ncbi:uncharacterized protein LOC123587485 [Leopardus geoffroyi]|uniref:uncharacterized protein LOC123587485 n=1 Tax=Leopardus geoffroyi TaxID=46844 RepID=UPI001E266364|nr:uncharacterized protein LOC123587485 [Leopardus geoffroyi]
MGPVWGRGAGSAPCYSSRHRPHTSSLTFLKPPRLGSWQRQRWQQRRQSGGGGRDTSWACVHAGPEEGRGRGVGTRGFPESAEATCEVADKALSSPGKVQRSAVRTSSVDSAEAGAVLINSSSFPSPRPCLLPCFANCWLPRHRSVLLIFQRRLQTWQENPFSPPPPASSLPPPPPPASQSAEVQTCISPSLAGRQRGRRGGSRWGHWGGFRAGARRPGGIHVKGCVSQGSRNTGFNSSNWPSRKGPSAHIPPARPPARPPGRAAAAAAAAAAARLRGIPPDLPLPLRLTLCPAWRQSWIAGFLFIPHWAPLDSLYHPVPGWRLRC